MNNVLEVPVDDLQPGEKGFFTVHFNLPTGTTLPTSWTLTPTYSFSDDVAPVTATPISGTVTAAGKTPYVYKRGPDNIVAGDIITYDIYYNCDLGDFDNPRINKGYLNPSSVVIADTLPAALTLQKVTVNGNPNAIVVKNGNSFTVTETDAIGPNCSLGSALFKSTPTTVTVEALVKEPAVSNSFTNTATVTVQPLDGSAPLVGTSNEVTTVVEASTHDVHFRKVGPPSSVTIYNGDSVRYEVIVTNDGNVTERGLVFTDVLPAGTTLLSSSETFTTANGVLKYQVPPLAPNESKTFTYSLKVGNSFVAGDTITNQASVASSTITATPEDSPCAADATQACVSTVLAGPQADKNPIRIHKTANVATADENSRIIYTVTLENPSNTPRNIESLYDILDPGTTLVGLTQASNIINYSYVSGNTISLGFADSDASKPGTGFWLAPNTTLTLGQIEVEVNADQGGKTVTNSVIGSANNQMLLEADGTCPANFAAAGNGFYYYGMQACASTTINPSYTVGGRLYRDFNNNGIFDGNDIPLAGAPVFLEQNDNEVRLEIAYTDDNGYYSLTAPPGDYTVKAVEPPLDFFLTRSYTVVDPTGATTNEVQPVTVGNSDVTGVDYAYGKLEPTIAILTKEANVDAIYNPQVGDVIVYKYTIYNPGPGMFFVRSWGDDKVPDDQITLHPEQPTQDSFSCGAPTEGEGGSSFGPAPAQEGTTTLGGAAVAFMFLGGCAFYEVTQADIDAGYVTNYFNPTVIDSEGDPVPYTPVEETVDLITVDTPPNVEITKTADKNFLSSATAVGTPVTYTYTIRNEGKTPITVTSALDDKLGDVLANGNCTPAGPTLAVDEEMTCTLQGTVTAADVAAGSLTNTFTVTGKDVVEQPFDETTTEIVYIDDTAPPPADTPKPPVFESGM